MEQLVRKSKTSAQHATDTFTNRRRWQSISRFAIRGRKNRKVPLQLRLFFVIRADRPLRKSLSFWSIWGCTKGIFRMCVLGAENDSRWNRTWRRTKGYIRVKNPIPVSFAGEGLVNMRHSGRFKKFLIFLLLMFGWFRL